MAKFRKRQFVSGYIDLEVEAGTIAEAIEKFDNHPDIGAFTPQGFADTYYARDEEDITDELSEERQRLEAASS
jgi:hypothetical protein